MVYDQAELPGTVDDAVIARLAKDVLLVAASGGMPDTYWLTDSRIKRAAAALGWTPETCRTWAQRRMSR